MKNVSLKRHRPSFVAGVIVLGLFGVATPAPAPTRARADGDPPAAEEPYAVTMKVKGKVAVRGARGPRDVSVGDVLVIGQLLRVGEGARVWLLCRDGVYRQIQRSAELGLDADLDAPRDPVFEACLAEVARLASDAKTIVGTGGTRSIGVPRPLGPRSRLLTARPTFHWSSDAPPGRWRLVVERVTKTEDGNAESARVLETAVTGSSWSPPDDHEPLEPGLHRFHLEAVAEAEGEAPLRSASVPFLVLGEADRSEILERLASFREHLPEGDEALGHVLLAMFYRQDGVYLLEEAHRELTAALALAPDHTLAERMLEQVEKALGQR